MTEKKKEEESEVERKKNTRERKRKKRKKRERKRENGKEGEKALKTVRKTAKIKSNTGRASHLLLFFPPSHFT